MSDDESDTYNYNDNEEQFEGETTEDLDSKLEEMNIDQMHTVPIQNEVLIKKKNKWAHSTKIKAHIEIGDVTRTEQEVILDLPQDSEFVLDESELFYRRKSPEKINSSKNEECKTEVISKKRVLFSTIKVVYEFYQKPELPDFKSSKQKEAKSSKSKKKQKSNYKSKNDDDDLTEDEIQRLNELRKKRAASQDSEKKWAHDYNKGGKKKKKK